MQNALVGLKWSSRLFLQTSEPPDFEEYDDLSDRQLQPPYPVVDSLRCNCQYDFLSSIVLIICGTIAQELCAVQELFKT
jgi:hypothetical protein